MSRSARREIPRFSTPLIETHCHLDYIAPAELARILEEARAVGVERIVTIAVSPDNLDTVMALTRNHPDVWGTQGIHPHEANSFNDAVAATIRRNAADERIVAIGEIGLDYYYDHADRNQQRRAFEQQLQLAAELDLPVVIHSRDAEDDTRDMLANAGGALRCKGVIHSFTAGEGLAEFCLDAGFYLGFNGITTFNSADNVRAIVAATPVERILLETDAPYLTPVPYRGRPNAPQYLPFIAEQIAAVKSLPVEQLLQQARDNSLQLLFGRQ